MGDPHENNHVDVGNINAFIEQVDGGYRVEAATPEVGQEHVALSHCHLRGHASCSQSERSQYFGKILCVLDARTKDHCRAPAFIPECATDELRRLVISRRYDQSGVQLSERIMVTRTILHD